MYQMHLWLYQLFKSNSDSILSNFWCDLNMFNYKTLNIRNEAKKWNNIIDYILNEYLMNFGNDNMLTLQMENLLSESTDNENELLSLLEQYLKIGNFIFDGDENKINNNKFSWITKIICELDA
eukprot:380583_1